MGLKVKGFGLSCMVFLLSVASFSAAVDSRLVEATEKGDKEAVRSLLKQHADVNSPQADGATALAWAAHWDDLETADLLIRAGANVNAANDYGITPLLLACTNGSAAMVEKLLAAQANPNAASWAGETVLMRCARTGNLDAVKSLLARGADVRAKETQHAHTALMWAVAAKHPEVARVLLEHGADVNARSSTGFTPLLFAAQQGDMECVRILLPHITPNVWNASWTLASSWAFNGMITFGSGKHSKNVCWSSSKQASIPSLSANAASKAGNGGFESQNCSCISSLNSRRLACPEIFASSSTPFNRSLICFPLIRDAQF